MSRISNGFAFQMDVTSFHLACSGICRPADIFGCYIWGSWCQSLGYTKYTLGYLELRGKGPYVVRPQLSIVRASLPHSHGLSFG